MAEQADHKYAVGPPKNAPLVRTETQKRYFFLDQRLYKVLKQLRASDLLVAKDFEENKIVHFILSDAKRRMKPAYDTKEVARLLNRSRVAIQNHVRSGSINEPIKIMHKGRNAYGHPFSTMKWSEEDILALHEHLLSAGGGPNRKDGTLYEAPRLPTRKELLALLRQQPMFYMQTADGEFVPVWSAYNDV